jgi:hypothetical protein
MSVSSPDYAQAADDFKRGGWIVSLLGGAGMLARMLITDQSSKAIIWIRKILAAGIIGVITYFALHGVEIAGIYKALILAFSGMASPEVVELVVSKVNNAKDKEKPKSQSKPKAKRRR